MTEPTSGAPPAAAPTASASPIVPNDPAYQPATNKLTTERGLGKWLAEIGIVVVGVLLALGAQQTVETISWDQKVKVLEGAIRAELSNDL